MATKKKEEAPAEEAPEMDDSAITRPADETLLGAGEGIFEYVQWLEARNGLLTDELEAKPGAQSRGIFWIDLFGYARDPEGAQHQVKGNFTQRSDVDGLHATQLAFSALRFIKGTFKMVPYIPSLVVQPTNGGSRRKPAEQPDELEQQPEGQPEGHRRRRTSNGETKTETGTQEAIGGEQWMKVESMEVVHSLDKSQKYVRVKLGKWKKFGLPAYLDSSNMPEEVVTMVEGGSWDVGEADVTGKELQTEHPHVLCA